MSKKNITFDFVGKRKIWYIISLIIILAGIVSFAVQGLNFGIDFTGGSYVQLSFYEEVPAEGDASAAKQEVPLEDLRTVVNKYVEQTPTIQFDETNTSYIIRTELTSEDQVNELLGAIETEIGAYQVDRNELVGPTIGAELVKKAILALIIACGLMLVYITVRFQFWFGVSSIVALIHDALVVLAIFSIFQLEVSSSFIAAILTVIGYSINATIVLFDRVRETSPNFKASEKKALINDSISNTLARSVNTTITTLLTLLALIIFGGDTTKVFVLAMIVGIVAGFYSSVFISGSLYFDLSKFSKKNK